MPAVEMLTSWKLRPQSLLRPAQRRRVESIS